MSESRNRAYLVAAALAVLGAAAMGQSGHDRPDAPRYPGGPRALWNIPDGAALGYSPPVRVEIPEAGVRAPVMRVGRNPDGTVEVPPLSSARYAGWYDPGPAPGSRGSAVLLGHYDDLRGPAAFHQVPSLRPGEVVRVIRRDGGTAVFSVDAVEQVGKSRFPHARVYGRVGYAGLRLVTCGGRFDTRSHSYEDNVIVYAHLTGARHGR